MCIINSVSTRYTTASFSGAKIARASLHSFVCDVLDSTLPHSTIMFFRELIQHLFDIEIKTIRIEDISPLAGKSLADIGFGRKYEVTVLAIQCGARTITNPSGDTQLVAQDIVILIGTRECIAGVSSAVLSSVNNS